MDAKNLFTNYDNHQSFPLGGVAFCVNGVKFDILTPSDPK